MASGGLQKHLVIYAREPRLGAVKRRLGRDIGAAAAAGFYRRTLRDVLWRLGRDARWRTWLAVTPDKAVDKGGMWPAPPGTSLVGQGAGDLGARMARTLAILPPGPVLIVGSDIPEVTCGDIAHAFAALGRHDLVFGPADDGGYWLVGARRRPILPAGLFEHVRWSSKHALADTLANVPAGCSVAMADTLADVDDGDGWRRWHIRRRAARL